MYKISEKLLNRKEDVIFTTFVLLTEGELVNINGQESTKFFARGYIYDFEQKRKREQLFNVIIWRDSTSITQKGNKISGIFIDKGDYKDRKNLTAIHMDVVQWNNEGKPKPKHKPKPTANQVGGEYVEDTRSQIPVKQEKDMSSFKEAIVNGDEEISDDFFENFDIMDSTEELDDLPF